MLGDSEPFEMYAIPEVKHLASVNPEILERALAEFAPKIEYKLFYKRGANDIARHIRQFYCVHDGTVFGAMNKFSQKDNAMLQFLRYLVKHNVEGRWRSSVTPGLLGRLFHNDPWIDWMTAPLDYAADRVERWGGLR